MAEALDRARQRSAAELITEDPLTKARRLWEQMGQELPEEREPFDASADIDVRDIASATWPVNFLADFDLTIHNWIESGKHNKIRPFIMRLVQRRGLESVRSVVDRSEFTGIVRPLVQDLI